MTGVVGYTAVRARIPINTSSLHSARIVRCIGSRHATRLLRDAAHGCIVSNLDSVGGVKQSNELTLAVVSVSRTSTLRMSLLLHRLCRTKVKRRSQNLRGADSPSHLSYRQGSLHLQPSGLSRGRRPQFKSRDRGGTDW
jgi:hypothetical protein